MILLRFMETETIRAHHPFHQIADQAPWVPIYNPHSLVMLSARVGNYQFNPHLSVLIDQLWVR